MVFNLNVTDQDGPETDNGRVLFNIISGGNDDFLIKSDSGEIIVSTNAKLEVEKQAVYQIEVRRTMGWSNISLDY